MKMRSKKDKSKGAFALFLLCLAGLVFFTGCSTLSAKDVNSGKIFKINEVDQPPAVVSASMPRYPFSAAKEGIEGKVVVKMVIDSDGKVREPEVFKAEPEGIFDEAALEAIGRYEFKPAVKDGKNVDCIVYMPIVFALGQFDKEPYLKKYKLNEIGQPPKPVYFAPPKYPYEAMRKGISGKVVLKFVVAPDGRAYEPEVISSEPEGVFDEAALETIGKYKFKPAVKDGKPVACIVKLPLNFNVVESPVIEESSDEKVKIQKDVWKQ